MGTHGETLVQIGVRELRVHCIIGVRDHERERPQLLLVDLDLWYDATDAVGSDDLQHAIDYSAVSGMVTRSLVDGCFLLLERAAAVTADLLMSHEPRTRRVSVTLRKPAAIAEARCALVTVHRVRE
jgi:dihydroneopterin aldolase